MKFNCDDLIIFENGNDKEIGVMNKSKKEVFGFLTQKVYDASEIKK